MHDTLPVPMTRALLEWLYQAYGTRLAAAIWRYAALDRADGQH